jgi:hypothetical protein
LELFRDLKEASCEQLLHAEATNINLQPEPAWFMPWPPEFIPSKGVWISACGLPFGQLKFTGFRAQLVSSTGEIFSVESSLRDPRKIPNLVLSENQGEKGRGEGDGNKPGGSQATGEERNNPG